MNHGMKTNLECLLEKRALGRQKRLRRLDLLHNKQSIIEKERVKEEGDDLANEID